MNGQKLSCKEKQQMVDKYIANNDPYKPLKPLQFDLRGYAAYIEKHHLKTEEITEEILTQFAL